MTPDINEIRELLNQLEEAEKKKNDELYKNTAKKIAEKAHSLEKKKNKKKIIFHKKKHLRKSNIRVRIINKVTKIARMPLEGLKKLKNTIKSKVSNFFGKIKNNITDKVNSVKVTLQEKKHLIKRKKRRIVARVRIIKRVSKKRLQLLKKQIEVKSNSIGFTNLKQKAILAGLTVENVALKGAVAVKDAVNKAKITIIDKKNLAKKQIKRKFEKSKRFIKHITVDQLKKLRDNIIELKNKIVKKVKHEISDKRKIAGRIKLKITGKITKIKTVSIEKYNELKERISSILSNSYEGKHYADSSQARRNAMREFFKKHLNSSNEEIIKRNQEQIDLMRAQNVELLSELRGEEIEEPVSSRVM